jgi:hypothetical protein
MDGEQTLFNLDDMGDTSLWVVTFLSDPQRTIDDILPTIVNAVHETAQILKENNQADLGQTLVNLLCVYCHP